eukprot:NODE_167_length_16327_cov_0.361597.p4 type:complete len:327 gc:universal NODE_167_length_16327_cov_0.361597:12856-11876(-)
MSNQIVDDWAIREKYEFASQVLQRTANFINSLELQVTEHYNDIETQLEFLARKITFMESQARLAELPMVEKSSELEKKTEESGFPSKIAAGEILSVALKKVVPGEEKAASRSGTIKGLLRPREGSNKDLTNIGQKLNTPSGLSNMQSSSESASPVFGQLNKNDFNLPSPLKFNSENQSNIASSGLVPQSFGNFAQPAFDNYNSAPIPMGFDNFGRSGFEGLPLNPPSFDSTNLQNYSNMPPNPPSFGNMPPNPPSFGNMPPNPPSFGNMPPNPPSFGNMPPNPPSFGNMPPNPPSFGNMPPNPPSFGSMPPNPPSFGSMPPPPPFK